MEQLVEQMKTGTEIMEGLKETDQMKWAGFMNNVRSAAEKVVAKVGAKVDFVLCAIQRNPDTTEILEKARLTLIPYMTMEYIKEQVGVS